MRVRLAQMNPTVGDIQGNTSRIFKEIERAREQGVKLLIFPELAVCGSSWLYEFGHRKAVFRFQNIGKKQPVFCRAWNSG